MSSFDLAIKGGWVIDGTGSSWFKKDIAISGGKIVEVGHVAENAKKTINADGMIVAPGFVDMHTHIDMDILQYPDAENFIMQGVTTVVVGNCGMCPAPLRRDDLSPYLRERYSDLLSELDHIKSEPISLAQFWEVVENQGVSLNLAPLVAHGTVRRFIKGFSASEASREEMDSMKRLIAQGLEEGAFGMSTGLIYPPGCYANTEELIELASVMKDYGGVYASHIRNEGDRLIESVEEAIRIGEENDIPVEISHHKAAGRSNWGKVNATLRIMEQARQRGVEVNCDVYPYTASSTTITAMLPAWAMEGGVEKMLARLKTRRTREQMKQDRASRDFGEVFIGRCQSNEEYEGKSLAEILRKKSQYNDPYEGLFDLLLETGGNATIIGFGMDENDVRTVMSSPLSSIGSDASATAPTAGGKPHPRGYGTFPRVLGKYVREERLLTLEDAIRKMTSLPAGKIRLSNRGLIKEGFWADIVIFKPTVIKDKATFENPHQYPEGIECVIVNGQLAVDQGKLTGVRAGKVLKKG